VDKRHRDDIYRMVSSGVVVADTRKSRGTKDSKCVIRGRDKWLTKRELRTSNMLPSLIGSQCVIKLARIGGS